MSTRLTQPIQLWLLNAANSGIPLSDELFGSQAFPLIMPAIISPATTVVHPACLAFMIQRTP
jgi:hypothetical protein